LSPTGWWFGTFLFFHILGIIIPTDFHIFWEGLKSPTSQQSSLIQRYDVWFWLMATWPRTSPHMVMTYGVCWLLAIGRLDYYGQLYACSLLIWTTVDRTLGGRRNSALLRVKSDEKSMTWFSGKKKKPSRCGKNWQDEAMEEAMKKGDSEIHRDTLSAELCKQLAEFIFLLGWMSIHGGYPLVN
jgi:hypothetical protein